MPRRTPLILAGDIGGTKARLGVYSPKEGPRHPVAEEVFSCSRYPSLESLLAGFLSGKHWTISQASLGLAGPVTEGRVRLTNLDWEDDEGSLSAALSLPVHLINDLAAVAHAVPHLETEDLQTLAAGKVEPGGAMAVIAPGTGLGEAFLVWDRDRYVPAPSEGGHADFAPGSMLEIDLLKFLMPRRVHVSYESVCSGMGVPNLYAFFKEEGRYPEPDWLRAELKEVVDPTPVIINAAVEGKAEICIQTVKLLASILGSEAGNLSLKIYATGGIYIGGGLAEHILPFLHAPDFLQAFRSKGRFTETLSRIPVHVITNPYAGLIGAAVHGLNLVKEHA